MSLLFNMLFRLFIAFLPRNKDLLISWFQNILAVILEPKNIRSVTSSTKGEIFFFPYHLFSRRGQILFCLCITNSQSLLKLVSIVSDAIQPSHPLLPPSPSTLNLSQNQGLLNESVLHIKCPKHWSLSFSISPSNEYSALISFRIGWLDLFAVQGTLKSLLQHHR